jgi:hypothetical protein
MLSKARLWLMMLKFMTADSVFNCMGAKYQVLMAVDLGCIYILSHDMARISISALIRQ